MKRMWWRVCQRFLLLLLFVSSISGSIAGVVMGGKSLRHWMLTSPEFDVIDISVHDNELINTDELIMLSGLTRGTNIFMADLDAAHRQLKDDPRLANIFFRREYPNRVAIHVEEKKPIAYIQLDKIYGLDEEAHIIPISTMGKMPDLPVVTGCKNIRPGAVTRPRESFETISFDDDEMAIIQAIYIIEKIKNRSPEILNMISEVHMSTPEDPVLFTTGQGIAIRIGIGHLNEKLARLDQMLVRLEEDGITTPTIDLRFKDQVIIQPITTRHQPETKS